MEIQPEPPNPHAQTLFLPMSLTTPDMQDGRRAGSAEPIPLLTDTAAEATESCGICQSAITRINRVKLVGCDHVFCNDCYLDYLTLRVNERKTEDIMCPAFNCQTRLRDSFLEEMLPQEMFEKLIRFRRYNELEKNVNFRWCPRPDCEGYDIGESGRRKLTCSECRFVFCFYCGEEWHASGKCRAEHDKKMDRWAKFHHAKFCPNCKMRVQKAKGCDHMTCFKCHYQWCWLCGDRYSPPHYESCPVKKLRKRNPPWRYVFLLLFLPILFPFALTIGAGFFIEEQIVKSTIGFCWNSFLRKRFLSYPIICLIALSITPLVYALVVLFVFVGILAEFGRYFRYYKNCLGVLARRRCLWVLISVTMGMSLSPVAAIIVAAGVVLAPVAAVFFILQKAIIALVRCCQPDFMRPNIVPGYSLG